MLMREYLSSSAGNLCSLFERLAPTVRTFKTLIRRLWGRMRRTRVFNRADFRGAHLADHLQKLLLSPSILQNGLYLNMFDRLNIPFVKYPSMKTAIGLQSFFFGAVKSLPLLVPLLVSAPNLRADETSVDPGTNDGDFCFVVSGTDSSNQVTRHIFKGNIKRFTKGVVFGLNDPQGTATFVCGTNAPVTQTNYWMDVSPSDGYVGYGSLDMAGSVGGWVQSTNGPVDTKTTTGLKYIARAQFPPSEGLIEGLLPGAKKVIDANPLNSEVHITVTNPPMIKIASGGNGTLHITCPTNTAFPFDTLYCSTNLGTWTVMTNAPAIVGTNYQWNVKPTGNAMYKVGTW